MMDKNRRHHNKTNLLLSITSISLLILLITQQGFIFMLTQYQPRQMLAQNAATICLCASLFGPAGGSLSPSSKSDELLKQVLKEGAARSLAYENIPAGLTEAFEGSSAEIEKIVRSINKNLKPSFKLYFDNLTGQFIKEVTIADSSFRRNIGEAPELLNELVRDVSLRKDPQGLRVLSQINNPDFVGKLQVHVDNIKDFYLALDASEAEYIRFAGAGQALHRITGLEQVVGEMKNTGPRIITSSRTLTDQNVIPKLVDAINDAFSSVGETGRDLGIEFTVAPDGSTTFRWVMGESEPPRFIAEVEKMRVSLTKQLAENGAAIPGIESPVRSMKEAEKFYNLLDESFLMAAEDDVNYWIELRKAQEEWVKALKVQGESSIAQKVYNEIQASKIAKRTLAQKKFGRYFLFCLPLIAAGAFISDPNLIDPTKKDVEAAKEGIGTFSPDE